MQSKKYLATALIIAAIASAFYAGSLGFGFKHSIQPVTAKTAQYTLLLQPEQPKTSSITQYRITWTFDREYEFGQFANGDYWVVGPVTIIGITPASTVTDGRTKNGSMLDPSSIKPGWYQGFDSSYSGYSVSYNVARPSGSDLSAENPLIITSNHSLVSAISTVSATDRPRLTDAAVLTILGNAPDANSFRPPYSGTDKTIRYNVSDLDYSGLSALTPVASAPSLATIEGYFERPWLDFIYVDQYIKPLNNMSWRGDVMAEQIGDGALFLNLNYTNAQKKTLMIRFVQLGIDLYGVLTNGGRTVWTGNGAFNQGRKMPILFAGTALNDQNMLAIGNKSGDYLYSNGYGPGNEPPDYLHFGEDDQIFYITAEDIYSQPYTMRYRSIRGSPGTNKGTVKVVKDSNIVEGVGTTWLDGSLSPSYTFYFGVDHDAEAYKETDQASYIVKSVDSDTQITLTGPYRGDSNQTGKSIYIISTFVYYGHGSYGAYIEYDEYTASHLGLPEWGIEHSQLPYADGLDWSAIYRANVGRGGLGGHQLTALIMGLKTLWNHDAYFDYVDRYMQIMVGQSGRSLSVFSADMWDAYRADYGCVWTRNNQSNYSSGHYDCSNCLYNCLQSPYCGDGTCNGTEDSKTCAWDCKTSSECAGTDISCGAYSNCANCDLQDSCIADSNRNYYCSGTSCTYTEDNCTDCTCNCGDYNATESTANNNCSDTKDNDCDGSIDNADSGCQTAECIDTPRLLSIIGQWKQGTISMIELMQRIGQWKTGTGC